MQAGEALDEEDNVGDNEGNKNNSQRNDSSLEYEPEQEGSDRKKKYGRKADIWSFGMTICELATGQAPFKSAAAAIYSVCVSKKLPFFPEYFSDEAHTFLARCLVFEPRKRADCQQLRSHPFLIPKVSDEHLIILSSFLIFFFVI